MREKPKKRKQKNIPGKKCLRVFVCLRPLYGITKQLHYFVSHGGETLTSRNSLAPLVLSEGIIRSIGDRCV